MKKTAHELNEIAGWLAATDIGFLELRMPGSTVRLGEHAASAPAGAPSSPPTEAVTAASVGEFLHAHPEGSAALVHVGAEVQAGQTLGLLRIGVLLLPVTAHRAGTVAALRADNGATVGYGAALIDLQPT